MNLVRPIVFAALFAALCALGSVLIVPLPFSPVPITMQTLFVYLAALVLGPLWGTAAVALWIILGVFGLPVFAGGSAGPAVLAGPTGGFLIGSLGCAALLGWLNQYNRSAKFIWRALYAFVCIILATLLLYASGVTFLKIRLATTWPQALAWGAVPFFIGDFIKASLAALIYTRLYPLLKNLTKTIA